MWGPKGEKERKPCVFVDEVLEFEHACVCITKSGENGKECKGAVAQKDKRGQSL